MEIIEFLNFSLVKEPTDSPSFYTLKLLREVW